MFISRSPAHKLRHLSGIFRRDYHRRSQKPKPPYKHGAQNFRKRTQIAEQIPFVEEIKQIEDPNEALSLFYEYQEKGFKHDYPSYSSLIYKLARAGNFEHVETLLVYLKKYNIRCKESLFIALFDHYCKAQMFNKAIELFKSMTSFNCVRRLQSFNSILNCLIDYECISDANEMFLGSAKMGFRLNSVSFNVMIKLWLQKGEWDSAQKVFDEMLHREVEPSVVTYNSLIGFLCKRGEIDEAKVLFKDMVEKGKRPNAVTYALLMEGLCCVGKFKEAKKVMFDMEYQGCKTRLLKYGVLMSDLAKRGEFEEAKVLMAEMRKKNMKPDVVIFNILINHYCRDGRVGEAYKVLMEMELGDRPPNAATYRTMLDGFCRECRFEDGLKMMNLMLNGRHFPRAETFFRLFIGLVNNGSLDNACYVLEEMEKRDVWLDLESWETLVQDSCPEEKAGPSGSSAGSVSNAGPVGTAGGSIGGAGPVGTATGSVGGAVSSPDHALTFFMHDILGGSNPTAIAVTGLVTNPALGGQVPFAKPNGAILPVNNGVPVNNANSGIINNNNIPFLTGLSGTTPNLFQQNGNGNSIIGGGFGFPALNVGQLGGGNALQKLMFGTMTVFDDEITEGHTLTSGLVGKAQGFYIASSEDGTSQTMAFTVMFKTGSYEDSLSFFGVHKSVASESHLAIMGGTGKYVNAKGFALVKTHPPTFNQVQETDGIETVLEISVYLAY